MKLIRWVALALALVGCDKAKGAYDDCVRLTGTADQQRGKGGAPAEFKKSLKSARDFCEAATNLDADSTSGKAALAQLKLISKIEESIVREELAQAARERELLRAETERIRAMGGIQSPARDVGERAREHLTGEVAAVHVRGARSRSIPGSPST